MKFRKKLLVGAVAATAALGAGSGIAFAVWTVTGSGSGGAAATVASNLVITAVTPTGSAATLYPGGPASAVDMTIANPNPFAVTINTWAWGTPISSNPTSCPNANVTVDANAPLTASLSIPANATANTTYVITGVLDMSHNAPNGCQGMTFTVPVTATATQQ
jgi:hypothetical protein